MKSSRISVPVSKLKAELLEYVRKVEQGQTIDVTKDGTLVARLVPIREDVPLVGFAKGAIVGSLDLDLTDDWEVLKASDPDGPLGFSQPKRTKKRKK